MVMNIKIFLYVALIVYECIFLKVQGQIVSSPCPDVLEYEPQRVANDGVWHGRLILKNSVELLGIWILIKFDREVESLGNWFGAATSVDNKEFTIRNNDFYLSPDRPTEVKFFVMYKKSSDGRIPRVDTIRINGKLTCNVPPNYHQENKPFISDKVTPTMRPSLNTGPSSYNPFLSTIAGNKYPVQGATPVRDSPQVPIGSSRNPQPGQPPQIQSHNPPYNQNNRDKDRNRPLHLTVDNEKLSIETSTGLVGSEGAGYLVNRNQTANRNPDRYNGNTPGPNRHQGTVLNNSSQTENVNQSPDRYNANTQRPNRHQVTVHPSISQTEGDHVVSESVTDFTPTRTTPNRYQTYYNQNNRDVDRNRPQHLTVNNEQPNIETSTGLVGSADGGYDNQNVNRNPDRYSVNTQRPNRHQVTVLHSSSPTEGDHLVSESVTDFTPTRTTPNRYQTYYNQNNRDVDRNQPQHSTVNNDQHNIETTTGLVGIEDGDYVVNDNQNVNRNPDSYSTNTQRPNRHQVNVLPSSSPTEDYHVVSESDTDFPPTRTTPKRHYTYDSDFFSSDFVPSTQPSLNHLLSSQTTRRNHRECGTVKARPKPLIINGEKSNEGEWPWHGALYHAKGIDWSYICGASLMTTRYMITAAHCVTRPRTLRPVSTENLLVYLGKTDLRNFGNSGIQNMPIESFVIHPEFNYSNFSNDIAVLRLGKEAQITNYVRPLCLWEGDAAVGTDRESQLGTVVGWGITEAGVPSSVLLHAKMPIVDTLTCVYSNPEFFGKFTSDKTYCAGFRNGTSACNGDSGGGMVFKKPGTDVWQLRGVVSLSIAKQGEGVCDSHHYIVFTDVAKYTKWLETEMNLL